MPECPGPVLAAALEPGDDAVPGEFGGHGLGDVVGFLVGHGRALQPVPQFVVAPVAAQRGGRHRLHGLLLVGDMERGAERGARVPRGGLHPDVAERCLPVQPGVGHAVEGDAAREGEHLLAGTVVQPSGEAEQDLLQAGLGAGGEVGVVLRPVGARRTWGDQRRPRDGACAEAAVAVRVDVLACRTRRAPSP